MVEMLTPNFSRAEMQCKCGCGLTHMDEKFMEMLQQLRNKLGALPITSAFDARSIIRNRADIRKALIFNR